MDPKLLEEVLLKLHSIGSIKFGEFYLKSGLKSPVYFDLRLMVSDPILMKKISQLLVQAGSDAILRSNVLCGVPYTALPLATLISVDQNKPMLIRRKEAKTYGTAQMLEGKYEEGENCLIIEDVITSGLSIIETSELLQRHGLKVDSAIVFLDRNQGGHNILASRGINIHCVTDTTSLMSTLLKRGRVDQSTVDKVLSFMSNNRVSVDDIENRATPVLAMSYEERLSAIGEKPPVSKLFKIMIEKKSNLCVAADLGSVSEIKNLAETIGDKICCLKIHYDIVKDWNSKSGLELRQIADKLNFLLFEDRKFFDIGNTVKQQLSSGPGMVSAWADFVTVVSMPGPAVLDAVAMVKAEEKTHLGVLLVAEMSSQDNLFTSAFGKKCVEILIKYPEVAVGLISQSRLETSRPEFIQMTPGVKLANKQSEGLGQQYVSPEEAILKRGADVIIVGRGVTHSSNPAEDVEAYRVAGWDAYLKRIQ